jgi:hypothetical protein
MKFYATLIIMLVALSGIASWCYVHQSHHLDVFIEVLIGFAIMAVFILKFRF